MMTFAELVTAVRAVDPTAEFSVDLEYWWIGHASVKWCIWSVRSSRHYNGDTAEAALASYRSAIAPVAVDLESIGGAP